MPAEDCPGAAGRRDGGAAPGWEGANVQGQEEGAAGRNPLCAQGSWGWIERIRPEFRAEPCPREQVSWCVQNVLPTNVAKYTPATFIFNSGKFERVLFNLETFLLHQHFLKPALHLQCLGLGVRPHGAWAWKTDHLV